VASLRKTKPSGNYSFDIPVDNLAAGKYMLSFYNNDKLIATKELIKL
jgi:hypothetical protein